MVCWILLMMIVLFNAWLQILAIYKVESSTTDAQHVPSVTHLNMLLRFTWLYHSTNRAVHASPWPSLLQRSHTRLFSSTSPRCNWSSRTIWLLTKCKWQTLPVVFVAAQGVCVGVWDWSSLLSIVAFKWSHFDPTPSPVNGFLSK